MAWVVYISQRVSEATESAKTAWTLYKHMNVMAKYGIILDLEQDELDGELIDEKMRSEEDKTCFQVLEKLLELMKEADGLTKDVNTHQYDFLNLLRLHLYEIHRIK
jgi:hypothetical protein